MSASTSTSTRSARSETALPDVHLKCYTASEIHHMTTLSGLTHEQVLRELRQAGLGSLPGGGAEIFADRVRALVAPGKEHADIWFHVHDTAHRLGIPTHCTMLYGHVETYEERVDHIAAPPRAAGPHRRLPRVHPARVPPGEHRLRAPRLAPHDRRRRPQDARFRAPDARQRAEHQGLLDHDGDADGPGRAPLRRERRTGHGDARGDLPGRRRHRGHGADSSASSPASSARPVGSPSSATRCTTRYDGGPPGTPRDPARADLVRQHGAGLPPADLGRRGDHGRPHRAQPDVARRRDRHRADLVDRVRPRRVAAAAAPAPLRVLGGRGRLDPARHAASRSGAFARSR